MNKPGMSRAARTLVALDVELTSDQHAWLTYIARKYAFDSASKALRIALLHAQQRVDAHLLWRTIRCRHCGVGGRRFGEKRAAAYCVYDEQAAYLASVVNEHAVASVSKCARIVLDLAIMRGAIAETELFAASFGVKDAGVTYEAVLAASAASTADDAGAAAAAAVSDTAAAPVQRTFFGLDHLRSADDA